jgi:cytochrome b561
LHWAIALLILITAFLALGGGGEGRRQAGLTIAGLPSLGIHMILGLAVLVLLIVRLVIRWRTPRPQWASAGSALLDKIGVLTHWGLYFFTFAITITGLILALQTNRLSRVFNLPGTARAGSSFTAGQPQPGQLPPSSQFRPGQFPPGGTERGFERGGGFFLGAFHGLSWTLLLLLILLHVGASLYHQFLRRDGILSRMWFGSRFA